MGARALVSSEWLMAFGLTVAVEVPVLVFLGRLAEPRLARRVGVVLLANALSHPVVWFAFPALRWPWLLTTIASEGFAWLGEAAVYRLLWSAATGLVALRVSLVANLLSFGVGLAFWALGWLG